MSPSLAALAPSIPSASVALAIARVAFLVVALGAFALYRRGVLGGGAVKLLAALAMVLGAAGALPALALAIRTGFAVAGRSAEERQRLTVTTTPSCAIGSLLALALALAVRFVWR